MGIFHDQILVEEADGLFARRRRQTNQMGVKIIQHLSPHRVDGAMALINDNKVEELDGQLARKRDIVRRCGHAPVFPPLHTLNRLHGFVQLFILEHRVQPLDGADVNPVHVLAHFHRIIVQVADVVQFGKFAAIVGRLKLDKLVVGLFTQVVAVNREEFPPGVGMFDEAVDEVDGGEGFCHYRWPSAPGRGAAWASDCSRWVMAWICGPHSLAVRSGGRC